MSEQYDADYYLRGKSSGKSLYEDYHWLPDLTLPMARAIINHAKIDAFDKVLDFGCARGYVVKAFREMGYDAWGVDVSEWAIKNCDSDVKHYVQWTYDSLPLQPQEFDWVIAKDVLEHVPNVADTIDTLMGVAKHGIFVVVPLAAVDGFQYVVPGYEKDVTHIHRFTLPTWARGFIRPGWSAEARYRLKGVKDNYYQPGWETGNGFITARRITC